jgi:hypothetical protein
MLLLFPLDIAKPLERWGRKATGLIEERESRVAWEDSQAFLGPMTGAAFHYSECLVTTVWQETDCGGLIKPPRGPGNCGNREVNMQTRFLKFLFLLCPGVGRGQRRQRMGLWAGGVAVVLFTLFMAAPSSAAMASYKVSFTATGFTSNPPGTTVPSDLTTVTGSFTITFDPTVNIYAQDPPPGHPIGGTYSGTIPLYPNTLFLGYQCYEGYMVVGGEGYVNSIWNYENQLGSGTNDIYLGFNWGLGHISSPNAVFSFISTEVPGQIVFNATSVDVNVIPVSANLIVDTGPGPSGSGYSIGYGQFDQGVQWQYLAAQFSLSKPCTLSGVQGWLASIDAGNADFVIYSNSGDNLPGTQLYRQSLHINKTYDETTSQFNPGWYGPAGLTWKLAPGTYWVAFETKDHLFYGAMPHPSPNPLINYAVWGKDTVNDPPYDPGWLSSELNLGVRIYGDINAVLTGALLLLID